MYLEEPQCDARNWIIGGAYLAITACAWLGVASFRQAQAKTIANTSTCCLRVLESLTPACQHVVENVFGKGLTVSNITTLCKETFPAIKSTDTVDLAISGSFAAVLTIGGLFYVGKKLYECRKVRVYHPVFPGETPTDT